MQSDWVTVPFFSPGFIPNIDLLPSLLTNEKP